MYQLAVMQYGLLEDKAIIQSGEDKNLGQDCSKGDSEKW
jgi:hypothetical protein